MNEAEKLADQAWGMVQATKKKAADTGDENLMSLVMAVETLAGAVKAASKK